MRPQNEAEDVAGARIIGIARDDCVGDQECAAKAPTVAAAGIIGVVPAAHEVAAHGTVHQRRVAADPSTFSRLIGAVMTRVATDCYTGQRG